MDIAIKAVFCRQGERRCREQLLMHCVCIVMGLVSSFCQVLAQTFLPSDELHQESDSSEKKKKVIFFSCWVISQPRPVP